MRYQKNLYPLVMLAAGFALGLVLSTMFSSHLSLTVRQQGGAPDCSKLSSCVCDREAEKLKRLARLMLLRSQITLNSSCFKESKPQLSPKNITEYKRFLYPNNPDLVPGVPLGVPKLLRQEYMIKQTVVVGILTQQEYLSTRAQAVYETWGKEVSKVVFFVGEDCNISANLSHLPIVKLKGIPDHVYPPLRKAFAVMQYMYDHYLNEYNWFVRADDDMYVRGQMLVDLLKDMNPYERVYLGRAGVGKDDDLDRLHLLPHERYCMGGPGVIFSYAAMRSVGPHLNECMHAIFYHDKHSTQKWNDDDVEIGRCISRKLDFQCSTSEESRIYFYTDYIGDSLHPLTLWTKPLFHDTISIHPVKDPDNMKALHHFYKTLEFEQQYNKLYDLTSYISQLCRNLPEHLTPPSFVSTGCHIKLSRGSSPDARRVSGSFLVPGNSSVFANPMNKFELTHWSYFNKDMYFDPSSLSPRHVFQPSFHAEVNHLQKLLQSYLSRSQKNKEYRLVQIVHGYTRFVPTTGREFILSIKLVHKDNPDVLKFRTVRLLRRFSADISVTELPTESRTVNVLLPLAVVDERLSEFLQNYIDHGLRKGVYLSLVIVVFSEKDANEAETVVKSVTKGLPKALVTLAIAEGDFSFPRAVEIGMSVIRNRYDLVFVVEVSMRMTHDFWLRCRENTHLKKQVYFPIPFWIYESDQKTKLVNETSNYPIEHWTGQWVAYAFKAFCIRKLDYTTVGGFKNTLYSEDLFQRLIRSKIQVFQAPDPGLYQFWSSRTCDSLNSKFRRNVCLSLQQHSSLFPQVGLTEYLTEQAKSKATSFWFHSNRDG